jgi:hypothetical protein
MVVQQLRVNDVVYGVGGAFDKRLGKVTKVNPSKPAIEDSSGRQSCYWKLNLARVGSIDSRFGYCSNCKRPSEFNIPCPHNASGNRRCLGVIRGNYNWKLESQTSSRRDLLKVVKNEPMGIFLAKQLGAALFRLGISEVTDDIIGAVKQGLKDSNDSSMTLQDPKLEYLSLSTSPEAFIPKV